ncbi:protein mono-ADP-ribosyltransferase PARP10-like, partial [Cololabis saira]|uniref:protein mono-ADP-ribosyltransferase PARP10-like n=1 Tax=Cololabis saira TaxID=129043 RepID=UPI002AD2F6D2
EKEEERENRTLQVLQVPAGVDEELLSLYFENRRRSGGGPLESLRTEDGRTALLFEDAEAASRVLSRRHVLHGSELTVRRPPSKDRRRLLLRGIKPSTSLEMVELYVENVVVDGEDYTLHRPAGSDVVLVQLRQPLSQDFQSLSSRISRRPLDGVQVRLERLDRPSSVLVRNLTPRTSYDLLALYFESERGGGNVVTEVTGVTGVTEVTELTQGAAKVTFASADAVDAVLDRLHRLSGADLEVTAYFPFLLPPETETSPPETSPDQPDPPETETSPQQTSPDSETREVLAETLDPQTEPGPPPAPDAGPAGLQAGPPPAPDAGPAGPPSAPDAGPAGLQAGPPSALGPQPASDPLPGGAGPVLEPDPPQTSPDPPETPEPPQILVPVPDPGPRALVQSGSFQSLVLAGRPGCSVRASEDGVSVTGPDRREVEQLEQKVLDLLGAAVEARFPVEPDRAHFLLREDVRARLLEAVGGAAPDPAVFTVSDGDVVVTALTRDSADRAWAVLQDQVSGFQVLVDGGEPCMLHCREWTRFHQALPLTRVEVGDRVEVQVQVQVQVQVLTLKGLEQDRRASILKFLATPLQRETVVAMAPGVLKYLQIHQHQLLADMDQVTMDPLEGGGVSGLKVQGHAVAVQTAEEFLQDLVSGVCTKTITIRAPGVTRFLQEDEDCRNVLKEMEKRFTVYIHAKCEAWEPLEQQDVFTVAWQLMSQENFQKVVTDGSADSAPVDQNKGLLQEGQRLVSAVDSDQKPVSEVPLEDLDHLDLYSAEEPGSLQVLQEPEAPAGASGPPPGQAGASGPAPGQTNGGLGLLDEEEAQLSLAIQYSLDMNPRSLEDEEQQLQKALELSKSLVQVQQAPRDQQDHQVKEDGHRSVQEQVRAAGLLQLEVFAGYSSDLLRSDIAFTKKVKQRQVEEKLEQRGVRHMSRYHHKVLEAIRRKHGVELEIQGTIIAVSGFKDYVSGAVSDVKLLLERISGAVPDREVLKSVQWLHHDPPSSGGGPGTTAGVPGATAGAPGATAGVPYPPEATLLLENAWRTKLARMDVTFDHQPHTVSFEKMEEHNITTGKTVKISRRLPELGDVTQDIPEEEYSLLSHLPEATRVGEESDEFQEVVKTFYETINEYHSKIRIIQVEKLMNRLLYNQYKLKKASVLQQSSHPQVERTLYHGTGQDSVREICVHGFNRSFCGKNATVYGRGVYFAVNSALSVQDQYSPPNADGYKFVLVSKVLTGDFTRGDHGMKTAPLKETGAVPLRYDSVTDDITKPSMFVIFNDTQAFPEYLITCQRVHR